MQLKGVYTTPQLPTGVFGIVPEVLWEQEVAGSSPVTPIFDGYFIKSYLAGTLGFFSACWSFFPTSSFGIQQAPSVYVCV